MRGSRVPFWVPVGLALTVLTACAGGGSGKDGDDGPSGTPTAGGSPAGRPSDPTVPVYDPPVKFDSAARDIAGGTGQGAWTVRLDGTTAYAVSDGEVRAVSVLDGKPLWSVKPQGRPGQSDGDGSLPAPRPSVVQLDGRRVVLAAFAVVRPGSGTAPERAVVELTAVAADSGERLWTTTLDRPEGQQDGDLALVGAEPATAVVRLGDDSDAVTLGIDLATRKTAWTAKGFIAEFVDRGTVVGRSGANGEAAGGRGIEGYRLADGTKAWTYASGLVEATLRPVGGGLFTARQDPVKGEETEAVVASSTGRPPAGLDAGEQRELSGVSDLTCLYDERATIVCGGAQGVDRRVFALDAQTFAQLWTIDEAGGDRLVPEISTAWHGAVYGKTDNGPVVLDARTGKDKSTAPGVTPVQVNQYVGLSVTSPGTIEAHRATG